MTFEQAKLLQTEYEGGVEKQDIIDHLNAVPDGDRITITAMECWVRRMRWRRTKEYILRKARARIHSKYTPSGNWSAYKADPVLPPLRAPRDGGLSVANRLMLQDERTGCVALADGKTVSDWAARYCAASKGKLEAVNQQRVALGLPIFVLSTGA